MESKGLVLMEKVEGILQNELGSYEIEDDNGLIFKAFVENNVVNLFLTTDRDVSDDEYNEFYDLYNIEALELEGYEVEEVEEEYNPVWCIKFDFDNDHLKTQERLTEVLEFHTNEIERINSILKQ
ncbi:hypothetical protein Q428_10465 [Fervidicella metallireducens AeB]|uniref:Uncharacterized protein n=1 Tax=Fervidicella metallireducens AeB TaxID=1403537 RepID=A0A017RTR8_9CLOT|nr:DUF6762 family protein [Fervidicella metallireducens]EYE87991.1 hypothetical protein Q428_10465 [Fervidicella metallireducens AeB]